MNEILPIAYTQVDWKIFSNIIQEALGESPTRGLDREGIKLSDLQAYLASLGLDNKPLEQLRDGAYNGSFKHVHFSFATIVYIDTITKLQQDINVYYKMFNQRLQDCLAIYTADMETWKNTIIKYAVDKADFEVRATVCRIMNHFETFGFKDLWCNYTKQTLDDKTFILVHR